MAIPPRIRVLLVDDNPMFRTTVRSLFASHPDLELIGEATDGQEAIQRVGELKPAVVLMDIHLHRTMDGIAATRLIKSRYPDVAVLGLSNDTREYVSLAMKEAGAFEVLVKDQLSDHLRDALDRAVAAF